MDDQIDFETKFAHFLTRTNTQYVTANLKYLPDRGIENRLLDNLLEYLPDGAVIAGGFALSVLNEDKNAKDIDIFFTNEKALKDTLELFLNPPEGAWAYQEYKFEHASSVDEMLKKYKDSRYISATHVHRPSIQLLKMVYYTDAAHVIDTFDFTVSQFAFTNKEFVFNGLSMLDVARKRLVLHRMQFPASTLRRLVKYTHKGYYACPGSLVTICDAIKKFNGEPDINEIVYVD
jgi:hypothetical protein